MGDAYKASNNPAQEVDAIAIYLTAWMVITFLFLYVSCLHSSMLQELMHNSTLSLASLRKSIGLTALFFFLTTTFLLLAVGEYFVLPDLNLADVCLCKQATIGGAMTFPRLVVYSALSLR